VPFALGPPFENLGGNAAEPDIVIRPIPWGLRDGGEESIRRAGFIVGFAPWGMNGREAWRPPGKRDRGRRREGGAESALTIGVGKRL
jgi:hypothetical protein